MNGGDRFPHCPVAPGKGCQSCYDIVERAEDRGFRLGVAGVTGVVVALLVLAWLVTR